MLRSDKTDIQSLIDYIKDIKPFHTKLTDVLVEYQHHDTVGVTMTDAHRIRARQSSAWEYRYISNGVTNRYRLPPVCLPRNSYEDGSRHLWTLRGVVDQMPGYPGAYRIPYNNGLAVVVNGVEYTEGVEYTIVDPIHDVIYFNAGFEPALNDVIECRLIHIDKLYINVGGVWATVKVQGYDEVTERYDPYNDGFDRCSWGVFIWGDHGFDDGPCGPLLNKDQAYLHDGGSLFPGFPVGQPIGWVRVLTDMKGAEYYVFEFDEWIFKNHVKRETKLEFRVEQAETYNNIARTVITDALRISDLFKYRDDLNVNIRENVPERKGYGEPMWGVGGFEQDEWHHPWIQVRTALSDSASAAFSDAYADRHGLRLADIARPLLNEATSKQVSGAFGDYLAPTIIENLINGFDILPFDTTGFDYTTPFLRMMAAPEEGVSTLATANITDSVMFDIIDHDDSGDGGGGGGGILPIDYEQV
jgi:hypothetical protein